MTTLWRHRAIADLDYPRTVGAFADIPGFGAHELVASRPFNGFHSVVVRNDTPSAAWPGGYFYARQMIYTLMDASDASSWQVETFLYPVDPQLTPAAAKKRIAEQGAAAPCVGTVYFARTLASAEEALRRFPR